jgi:hypothetical protein
MIPRSADTRSSTASRVSGDMHEPYSARSRSLAIFNKLRNTPSDSLIGSSAKERRIDRGRNVEAILSGELVDPSDIKTTNSRYCLSGPDHRQQIREHLFALVDNKGMSQGCPSIPIILR